jgi:TIR domain
MKHQQKQVGITVFYSYAPADKEWRDRLAIHLRPLRREGLIKEWSDQQILPGSVRDQEISQAIHSAQIILLLVSADFLASDLQYQIEMQRALERHRQREACVIPIIVHPCDWQHSLYAHLQCLPRNTRPITKWNNKDEAFLDVVAGIRQSIADLAPQEVLPPQNGAEEKLFPLSTPEVVARKPDLHSLLRSKVVLLIVLALILLGSGVVENFFAIQKQTLTAHSPPVEGTPSRAPSALSTSGQALPMSIPCITCTGSPSIAVSLQRASVTKDTGNVMTVLSFKFGNTGSQRVLGLHFHSITLTDEKETNHQGTPKEGSWNMDSQQEQLESVSFPFEAQQGKTYHLAMELVDVNGKTVPYETISFTFP